MNANDLCCVVLTRLLNDKNNDKINLDEFEDYFSCLPKTGILQIYLQYMEELFDNSAYFRYIEKYDIKNHDKKKEKSLLKHYKKYCDKHGKMTDFGENIYVSNIDYKCDKLNNTNQSHPMYHEFFGELSNFAESNDDNSDNSNYSNNNKNFNEFWQIGGYPCHLQDDMDFDDKKEIILFSYVNSCVGFNISINKKKLKKMDFKKHGFDLSY